MGGGAGSWQAEQQSTKSELLEVWSTEEHHSRGEAGGGGGDFGVTVWSQGLQGHRKIWGAWVWQSSQVLKQGSQLQRQSQGGGSQLGVTLHHDPRHSQGTALWTGTPQVADPGRPPPSSSGRNGTGACCRDLLGLQTPDEALHQIQTLGHRLGEHGVQPKTREMRMIDCFSLRVQWREGPQAHGSSRPETGRWPSSFSSSKAVWKQFREQKLPRPNPSRWLSESGHLAWPLARVVQFHLGQRHLRINSTGPLPQKINKKIQPRPSSPINENCKTSELWEYST